MEPISFIDAGLARLEAALAWLAANVVTSANLVQLPAVALTGVAAWFVARPLRIRLARYVRTAGDLTPATWLGARRGALADRLPPLLMPALWTFGLWVALAIADRFDWPSDVTRIAANLLLAWLCIRLVAEFVPHGGLARMAAFAAWTLAALNILHLLGPLSEALDGIAVTVGAARVSALTLIRGAVSLAVLLWAATLTGRIVQQRVLRHSDLSPRAQVLFAKLLKIGLIGLAFVLALTSVGLDLSAFALLTGAVGVGVGLGLQKTVSNLFSGIVLLLDRSIKPGDVIEVGGTYGWVSALGARYISVETRDGTEYLIPNEDIITQRVLNWSHKSERVRLKVEVRAPLDSDLDRVLTLMKEAARTSPRILPAPAPTALLMAFGESAFELQLRFWIADAHNGVQNVKGEVLLAIWRAFREAGIAMPVPRREVVVTRGDLPGFGEAGGPGPHTESRPST